VTPHQARRRTSCRSRSRSTATSSTAQSTLNPSEALRSSGSPTSRPTPAVALLVDHYADDWNELWWVRADGTGRVVDPEDPEGVRALSLLADRYPRFAGGGRARRRRTPLVRLGGVGRDRGRLRWCCCPSTEALR
jgi:hypothetical protein